jgi:7-cyano-7-deazaguanine reductase
VTEFSELQLGKQVEAPSSPEAAVLDCVPSPRCPSYLVRLTCPEFTSLCQVTGQPDFATIIVDYVPSRLLIESKAFKLFMQSFRSHRAFHEQCAATIFHKLVMAADPVYIRVCAFFQPRGGIPIDVFIQSGELPPGVCLPDLGVPT